MIVSSCDLARYLALIETTNADEFGDFAPRSLVLYVNAQPLDKVQWDVSFRAVKLKSEDRLGGVWHALGVHDFPPADWSEIEPDDVQVVRLRGPGNRKRDE
jgi:hypothetical protein